MGASEHPQGIGPPRIKQEQALCGKTQRLLFDTRKMQKKSVPDVSETLGGCGGRI